MAEPVSHAPARTPRWVAAVALLGPLAVSLVGWGWLQTFRAQLPEQVPVHWGLDGQPNQFASAGVATAQAVLLPMLMPLITVLLGFALRSLRPIAALATAEAVFLSVLSVGPLRDVGHHQTADVGKWMLIGLGAAAVIGVSLWLAMRDWSPAPRATEPLPAGTATYEVPPSARLAWLGATRITAPTWAGLALGLLPLTGLLIAAALYRQWALAASMAAASVAIAIVMGSMFCRVSVDRRGVRATSLGLTWRSIPLESIERASVESVEPLRQFGGWGWRGSLGGERSGLVTAKGPALVVHRAGGKEVLFTVDDADSAAATLNTLVEHRR